MQKDAISSMYLTWTVVSFLIIALWLEVTDVWDVESRENVSLASKRHQRDNNTNSERSQLPTTKHNKDIGQCRRFPRRSFYWDPGIRLLMVIYINVSAVIRTNHKETRASHSILDIFFCWYLLKTSWVGNFTTSLSHHFTSNSSCLPVFSTRRRTKGTMVIVFSCSMFGVPSVSP